MPFKFTDLAKKTKSATLDLGDGDVIQFEFRPALITPQFIHALSALDASRMQTATADQADATIQSVSDQVARIVASWDVQEDDGSPFPLDPARLKADIPIQAQVAILMACMQAMQPGEATAPQSTPASSPATK